MKHLGFIKLFLTLTLAIIALSAMSQGYGNIQGHITDESGLYVAGAHVYLDDQQSGDISTVDGDYTLIKVPAGTHTLTVKYLGFSDYTTEVTVIENQTTNMDISLALSAIDIEGVTIKGLRITGQAKALNLQKNNINLTNVVSTDQIGKFPDANIGDAVKRISGITMQVDQGEARNVIVRGLSPQLNSVTLNGSRIPSAEGDNRNVQMDLIPADMIQTIEVNKTVTPDMDGDALGGAINLVTRNAPQGFRLSTTLGTGVNLINDGRILNGSLIYGDRTADGKFGWMATTSWNDNKFASDNIEAEWSEEFAYMDGDEEVEVDVDPYTSVYEQRNYDLQRIRRSFALSTDYQISTDHRLYFKSMYNWRDDRENRYRVEHEILDAEDIGLGDFTLTGSTLSSFPVEVKRQTKAGLDNDRNKNTRLEDQRMQNYTLGGDHLVGTLKVDWLASYAKASEERLNERYAEYESEYRINVSDDIEFPLFTAVNAADVSDFENFEYGEITEENQYTEEEDFNALINFELPWNMVSDRPGKLKFGAKGRFKTKLRDNNFFEYDLEDVYPTLASLTLKSLSEEDFLAGEQYDAGSYVDPEFLGALDLVDGEDVPDEYLRANFDARENVLATYIMTTQPVSDNLTVLAGVRMEYTDFEATGNQILDEEDLIGQITESNTYTNFLPNLQLKYVFNENSLIRLGWTNTLARPNYVDLIPTVDVVSGDEEIFVGNPSLEPTTSMNFDLSAEQYFSSLGILSGGLFYKRINNFIYTYQTETTSDSYGEGTSGFDLFQPLNGDDASVLGAEFAFQKQLDFLPGFAKNLSIYLNYTYLTSDANGIRNEDGDEREDLDLPNTAPNLFNGSLSYGDDRFSARLSVNFSDAYIDEIGGDDFEDRYYDRQLFVDFNANYTVTDNLRIFGEVNNISNQPLRYYQSVRERTQQAEYYGRRITLGLKYDLYKK